MEKTIEALARKEDRSLGAMCRVLIAEALEARHMRPTELHPAQVRRTLSSLPPESLIRFIQDALHLLLQHLETGATAAMLIKALVRDQQPSSEEITDLARSLSLFEEELRDICKRK